MNKRTARKGIGMHSPWLMAGIVGMAVTAGALGAFPGLKAQPALAKTEKPRKAAPAKPAPAQATGVAWNKNWNAALAQARKTGKPLCVDFYATWCGPCKAMDRYTFTDPVFVKESRRWILVKIDAEASNENMRLAAKYGVTGYPTLALIAPDSKLLGGVTGYWEAKELVSEMQSNHNKWKKTGGSKEG